jgi:CDP-diglyceride synthetase
MRNAAIAVVLQLGWLTCVLCGARQRPWDALVAAAAVIACNLWLRRERLAAGLRLVALASLVGFGVETVNLLAGVFTLSGAPRVPVLCPVWLLALWAMFATALRGPLAWLSGRYALSALLGALFAAPNYFAGARLGAVVMNPDQ